MDCILSSKQVIVGCQIFLLKIIFMNIIYFVQLCQAAKDSPERFCWLSENDCAISSQIQTKLAIYLDNDGIKSNVILVCYSFSDLPFNAKIVQYLRALSISIYMSSGYIMNDENFGNDLDMVAHGVISTETHQSCGSESADSSVSPSTGSNATLVETAALAEWSESITDTQNRNLFQVIAPLSPSSPCVKSETVAEFLYPTHKKSPGGSSLWFGINI